MSPERFPSLERVYYETRLDGADVYYGFAQYCVWRTVVRVQHPDWLPHVPPYFLSAKEADHA